MDRCYYVRDGGHRVLIPGCIGAAVYGPSGCTCERRVRPMKEQAALEDRVDALEREVGKLKKLLGSSAAR